MNPKTVVRMGYGRSFDMGVFGSNFGHTVTQTLPVLAAQLAQGASQDVPGVYLGPGTANLYFPGNSSQWIAPGIRTELLPESSVRSCSGQNTQLCVQPHIRPTTQRLPTLDAWNATVQHQVTNTTSIEVAYIGNKGTHVFAGDGPTYNVNNPSMVDTALTLHVTALKTPQVYRRPYYNNFTYAGYPDPTNIQADLPASAAQACSGRLAVLLDRPEQLSGQ